MSLKLSPLGKGLEALIGDKYEELVQKLGETQRTTLPIHKIRPRSGQPRKNFDPEKIDALSVSIRQQGMLQPILVRPPSRIGAQESLDSAESRALAPYFGARSHVLSDDLKTPERTTMLQSLFTKSSPGSGAGGQLRKRT